MDLSTNRSNDCSDAVHIPVSNERENSPVPAGEKNAALAHP